MNDDAEQQPAGSARSARTRSGRPRSRAPDRGPPGSSGAGGAGRDPARRRAGSENRRCGSSPTAVSRPICVGLGAEDQDGDDRQREQRDLVAEDRDRLPDQNRRNGVSPRIAGEPRSWPPRRSVIGQARRMVGDTGFEPVTRGCETRALTTEPIAQCRPRDRDGGPGSYSDSETYRMSRPRTIRRHRRPANAPRARQRSLEWARGSARSWCDE